MGADMASTRVNSMTQRNEMKKLALWTASTLLLLTACGGGGTGGITSSAVTVSGTAATGAAMKNASITFKCQSKTYTAQGNAEGAYSISIDNSELPCLVRASVQDNTLHSIAAVATGSATVNITPQTELVTSHLLARSPASAFDANSIPTAAAASADKINNSIAVVRDGITSLVDTRDFNPLSVPFSIGDAYDQKLDALKASLAAKNITLATLQGAFISELPANHDRQSYIATVINSTSTVTVVDPPASINTAAVKEFLTEAYRWESGSSSLGDYFGFQFLKLENTLLKINDYQKTKAGNYTIPSQDGIIYGVSGYDLMLSADNAWNQLVYKKHILSNAQINSSPGQVDYWLKLNSDSGQKGIGKWKIEVQAQEVSGLVSNVFNPIYINHASGNFAAGSKRYDAWLKAVDSDYFVRKEKLSDSGATIDAFIAKYTNQIFCGTRISRFDGTTKYSGALFGIQFIQNNKAMLVPVNKDCIKVETGYPLVELSLEKTSINNQDAIELSGSKLPEYDSTLGVISGGYHASESDPGYRYATDKYKLIVVKNADGTFYTGVKTLPGASISISPGNGPYLNRAALNSLLTVVGYPAFSQ